MHIPEEHLAKIYDALTNGRKLEAVKIVREQTGANLLAAKREVERVEKELREKYPEKFPAQKSGCSSKAAVLILLFVLSLLTI
ncbi:MAG: hypothetical protein IAE91_06055 [Ignavibacteriaceae bacterium]|nr:hypothetical protein [Ignavibacteriaceae bacterium]